MIENPSMHTILVIEDNLPINKLFCKNLSASGYVCHGVTTIDEAIHHIENKNPNLLILDFELPDGYGTRVLDYLDTNQQFIPTIVVSASTRVLELRHYPQYKIAHILVKPVSPRQLADLVKQTLA